MKKSVSRHACGAVMTLLWVAVTSGEAHAYLDPGTGSYVVQMLIAGLLGAAFAVKTFWRNIRAFIAGLFSTRKKEGDGPP